MIDYSDIDERLEVYSNAFDFYINNHKMPSDISEEDCLVGYMKEVIDCNPQIDGTDPMWVEVLKEDLITFFAVLLEHFCKMQHEAMKEMSFIKKFRYAPIEEKRRMWQQVCTTIESGYAQHEVNLPGYVTQLREGGDGGDKDTILSALTGDWQTACENRLGRQEQQMLERYKEQFEASCKKYGLDDYKERKRIENYIFNFPQLKEIVDLMGRSKYSASWQEDSVVSQFLPITVAHSPAFEEVERVETGNNLECVLPVELSMPDDLFLKRYAARELQQFSSSEKNRKKKVANRTKSSRLTKGPMILCIDTSASMKGYADKIAYSLLRQLLRMAQKQKRPCFLISFSVHAQSIDFSKPRNRGKLDHFLEHSFSGGTDGEEMLARAISVLQEGTFEMADILVISDLEFPAPTKRTMEKINREKSLGTRFYALQIGSHIHDYNHVMDKIWSI